MYSETKSGFSNLQTAIAILFGMAIAVSCSGTLGDDFKGFDSVNYDFAICRRGNIGTIRTENLHTQSYKIVVNDKSKVDFVRNTILNFDWQNYKKHQSAPSLSKNDIYRLFQTQ